MSNYDAYLPIQEEYKYMVEESERLEVLLESVYNGEREVTNKLISRLRDFILDEKGEIDKEAVAVLKEFTDLKLVPRKVNSIDGPKAVFGVQYKNIGIEIGDLK